MQIYNEQIPKVNQITKEMLTGKSTELLEKCSLCKKEAPLCLMLPDEEEMPVCNKCVRRFLSRSEVPYLISKKQL